MKLLADENIGLEVVNYLRKSGHDVVSATEEFPSMTDSVLLKKAFQQGRILITSDKDFGELVYKNILPHKGVILLRLVDETNSNKIRVLSGLFRKYRTELKGNFVVATETLVRIRKTRRPS